MQILGTFFIGLCVALRCNDIPQTSRQKSNKNKQKICSFFFSCCVEWVSNEAYCATLFLFSYLFQLNFVARVGAHWWWTRTNIYNKMYKIESIFKPVISSDSFNLNWKIFYFKISQNLCILCMRWRIEGFFFVFFFCWFWF